MIKRLEGYTGNGFQERNGYIILNTDLNILKLKKAKNDEKKVEDIIGQKKKNLFAYTSSQMDKLNDDLSKNSELINNDLSKNSELIKNVKSNSFNNNINSMMINKKMKNNLVFNSMVRKGLDNNSLEMKVADKLDN